MSPLDMPAGPELDAIVAEKLGLLLEPPCARYHFTDEAEYVEGFGWSGWCYSCCQPLREVAPVALRYSTDIAAAWEVVVEMARRAYTMNLQWKGADREFAHTAEVSFHRLFTDGHAVADTAPLAICRAALAAMEAVEHAGRDG